MNSPDTATEPGRSDRDVDWWRPDHLGRPAANEAMTTVAAPLFAGFSVTVIGVTAQNPEKFVAPGLVMFLLAVGTTCFMISMQSGFQARYYVTKPAEIADWRPGYQSDEVAVRQEKKAQRSASRAYRAWEARSARYYSLGLLSMLAALATAVAPRSDSSQPMFRWLGLTVFLSMFLVELFWIYGFAVSKRYPKLTRHLGLERLIVAWFIPGRRLARKEMRKGLEG